MEVLNYAYLNFEIITFNGGCAKIGNFYACIDCPGSKARMPDDVKRLRSLLIIVYSVSLFACRLFAHSSRSRFLTSMRAFPNLFSPQHCRCDMASSAVYPIPHTRSCEAASASKRSPVSNSFCFSFGFCPNLAMFPATTTALLISSQLVSSNPAVNLARRFCSFGSCVASMRLCVSVSWKRPALQYIMNCSAQLK